MTSYALILIITMYGDSVQTATTQFETKQLCIEAGEQVKKTGTSDKADVSGISGRANVSYICVQSSLTR